MTTREHYDESARRDDRRQRCDACGKPYADSMDAALFGGDTSARDDLCWQRVDGDDHHGEMQAAMDGVQSMRDILDMQPDEIMGHVRRWLGDPCCG